MMRASALAKAMRKRALRAAYGALSGVLRRADGDALDAWCRQIQGRKTALSLLGARELDQAAIRLADWLRQTMAVRGLRPPLSAVLGKGDGK